MLFTAAAFSLDRNSLVCGASDGLVDVFAVSEGSSYDPEVVSSLQVSNDMITCIAFISHSLVLIGSTEAFYLYRFKESSLEEVYRSVEGIGLGISSCVVMSSSLVALGLRRCGTVLQFDYVDCKQTGAFKTSLDGIRSLAYENETLFIGGKGEGSIYYMNKSSSMMSWTPCDTACEVVDIKSNKNWLVAVLQKPSDMRSLIAIVCLKAFPLGVSLVECNSFIETTCIVNTLGRAPYIYLAGTGSKVIRCSLSGEIQDEHTSDIAGFACIACHDELLAFCGVNGVNIKRLGV